MPPKSKKILITTASREILTVREKGENAKRGFCPQCQKEVEWLTLDEATSHTGRRTRELFGLIENGSLHSLETTGGHLFICQSSLGGEEKL